MGFITDQESKFVLFKTIIRKKEVTNYKYELTMIIVQIFNDIASNMSILNIGTYVRQLQSSLKTIMTSSKR